jgi:hypothetical protein
MQSPNRSGFNRNPIMSEVAEECLAAWHKASHEHFGEPNSLSSRRLELAMYAMRVSLDELRQANFTMALLRLQQVLSKIEEMR